MRFDTDDEIYQELVGYVTQSASKVVPFVGAGLSVHGESSQRLPLWRELLDRLVGECRRFGVLPDDGGTTIQSALEDGRFIEATDLIMDALGEPNFRRAVERELDDTDKPVPPAVVELVAISWSLIVTTNLDRLVAREYRTRYGYDIDQITNLDVAKLRQAFGDSLPSTRTALAHIHGALDVYPSWRLTSAHYASLLQDPLYREVLRQLFARRILFIGFGMADDDFDYVRKHVAEIYPERPCEFYALIERSRQGSAAIRDLVKTGLRPIYYDADPEPDPSDPFNGHRAVYECLQHLATVWASRRTDFEPRLMHLPQYDASLVPRDVEIDKLTALLVAEQGCVVQVVGIGGSGKTSLTLQLLHGRRRERRRRIRTRVWEFVSARGPRRVHHRPRVGRGRRDGTDVAGAGRAHLFVHASAPIDPRARRVGGGGRRGVETSGFVAGEDRGRRPGGARLGDRNNEIARAGRTVRACDRNRRWCARSAQIQRVLAEAKLDFVDATTRRRIEEITAGHPLALRILVGVLHEVPRRRFRRSSTRLRSSASPTTPNRSGRTASPASSAHISAIWTTPRSRFSRARPCSMDRYRSRCSRRRSPGTIRTRRSMKRSLTATCAARC